MRIKFLPFCLLLGLAGLNAPTLANEPMLREWKVPYPDSRPRDPYVDASGTVWFVGQVGHYVASFTPATGEFQRISLDPGTGPHNLIVAGQSDEAKTIYYAGNKARHIGRINSKKGKIHKIMMPEDSAKDPHTLVFDDAGNIWFTLQASNMLGKLNVTDDSVRLVSVPSRSARPYGINIAPNGDVWATLFGTNKLLRINPVSFESIEVELPRKEARPRRLEITSDGLIWYIDYAGGYLGRLNPESGHFKEWRAPSKDLSFPYAMEVDQNDRIWFVETGPQPNLFVGFDTRTAKFISSVALGSGGGAVRHMHYDQKTNSIWFATDANTIGRAQLSE